MKASKPRPGLRLNSPFVILNSVKGTVAGATGIGWKYLSVDCLLLADSVEKVGFSNGLNSGTTTTGEPTHHIEWFFGPSLTFAASLLG
jgi:hypothetical protein